jgi:hypothetical protein
MDRDGRFVFAQRAPDGADFAHFHCRMACRVSMTGMSSAALSM